MESGLYIIYAIIIAVVILPFVFLIRGSKKKEKQLRNALQAEALQHHCKLDKIETHNAFALGLDSEKQKIVFYKTSSDGANTQVVDLKTVASCSVTKVTRNVKNKASHYDVIDQILLSFKQHNKKDLTHLEFYNNNDEIAMTDELVVAQKWQEVITAVLAGTVEVPPTRNHEHINATAN